MMASLAIANNSNQMLPLFCLRVCDYVDAYTFVFVVAMCTCVYIIEWKHTLINFAMRVLEQYWKAVFFILKY